MKTTKDFYRNRFPKSEWQLRNAMWKTLCNDYFQQFVKKGDTVMDMAAGYCEFINNIKCKTKIAVDINSDLKKHAAKRVVTIVNDPRKVPERYANKIDVIFTSNFLEHINSKEDILEILEKCNHLLRKGGKILILQPNIALIKERYWDFIDHKTPLTGKSVMEALEITGFRTDVFVRKFLPYTTKGMLPTIPLLISIYLQIPSFIRPFAGQSFFVGVKD